MPQKMPNATISPSSLSGSALAYLGDAVFEVYVRQMLLETGIGDAGRLNAMALDYVRATRQSAGMDAILPLLTEEEEAVYRRGRNSAGAHPKSATVTEYRRATGLEALFGYLFVLGETDRLRTLFEAYAKSQGKEESSDADEKE